MLPVDYVIPFVDCNDATWRNLYTQYVSSEIPVQRYRNYGTLKYQLRGIEKNLPWVNKIYLIVQSNTQLPSWLRIEHPKLAIVYHDDYIPNSELPAFKSAVIELNIHRIGNLSNNFILSNDDIIPIKPQPRENYFVDDRPVQTFKENDDFLLPNSNHIHKFMLYRLMRIEQMALNQPNFHGLEHPHLLCPYNKDFWVEIINKYKYTFSASRHEQYCRGLLNMSHWLIYDLQVLTGRAVINNSINTAGKINITDDTPREDIYNVLSTSDVVCMNDSVEENANILQVVPEALETILPEKSSFEL